LSIDSSKKNNQRTAASKGVITFRKELHQHPELSGQEKNTSNRILGFVKKSQPDAIVENIGGHGLAFVFDSGKAGPCVLFRTDMDALPIQEVNTFEYKSGNEGVAHKCGHDGHMAIMSLLSRKIAAQRPRRGKVVLLFQPAEETGEGAEKVIVDEKFKQIKPDMAFALHNLPGYDHHTIVMREGAFASASKGMIVKLKGVTSHAGEPENGKNPARAMAEIVQKFLDLPNDSSFKDFTLVTLIHTRLGERAFGTSAGYAEVMATLRTYRNDDMDILTENAEKIAREAAAKDEIETEISYTEEFPATVNIEECNGLVADAAKNLDLKLLEKDQPFRWSEDFGQFTNRFKGALFGLGSGKNQPQLHNPDYDFPDEIIDTGANMFFDIYTRLLTDNQES
jgi:amidohydrolase